MRSHASSSSSFRSFLSSCVPCAAALVAASIAPHALAQGAAERISVGAGGVEPAGSSLTASMSADGRFVAFRSAASNLVPGDTNGVEDIFVVDRTSGTTQRASVSTAGAQSDGDSSEPVLSADGTALVFTSRATNLVPNDTNGAADVFVRDLVLGTTERVNLSASGAQVTGLVAWVSISGDGALVAFCTDADLFTGAPGPMTGILFGWVRERATGLVQQVSIDAAGNELPATRHTRLTPDGHFVVFRAFQTAPSGFIGRQIHVRDLATQTTSIASVNSAGQPSNQECLTDGSISDDGRFVAFSTAGTNLVAGDTNGREDVFVHDRVLGTTERVSVSTLGAQANADCNSPRISADGRFVTFYSAATNLVPNDTNGQPESFLRDRVTHTTLRVTAPSGAQLDQDDFVHQISADGLRLLVVTDATNLLPPGGDTNGLYDVYLDERASTVAAPYCTAKLDAAGCLPQIAASGTPSTTSASSFLVTATSLRNNKRGRLHWSLAPSTKPFEGGSACIGDPLRSTRVLFSGGSALGDDCSGAFQVDFNRVIQQGLDPTLVPGTVVYAQFRYSDPGHPSGFTVGLSDAVVFAIAP